MTRILIVDDHPLVREGLMAVLKGEPDFSVVADLGSAEEAVAQVRQLRPDVAILDVRLPGMSGIEATPVLLGACPGLAVVVLTSAPNAGTVRNAFSAGARGLVVKESAPAVLRQAVRAVAGGHTFVDPEVAGKLVDLATTRRRANGPFGLTGQEMQVLSLLPRGLMNREIADELGISEHTVKSHLRNATRKLGVRDRAQAAAVVVRQGLA